MKAFPMLNTLRFAAATGVLIQHAEEIKHHADLTNIYHLNGIKGGIVTQAEPRQGGVTLTKTGADFLIWSHHADNVELCLFDHTGEEEVAQKMPDEFLRPLIGSMVGAELFKDVKPADCTGASKIVESLAPLPPENVSNLIGAVLTMVEAKKDETMPICKA